MAAENTAATMLAKIQATCAEAGLEVMAEVLSIVWNREEVPVEVLTGLDASQVSDLYEMFVGPAVDRVEAYLLNRD